jgi:hypothetical protein
VRMWKICKGRAENCPRIRIHLALAQLADEEMSWLRFAARRRRSP